MWKRLSQFVLPAILLVGLAGCYVQMRAPAGAYDSDNLYGYWTDPYYDYLPYSSPWEMYPEVVWWDPYHHWGPDHPHDDSWDSYEETSGRHGWDRGPGSPPPPRAGSLGGGVSGGTTPTAPAPAQTSDEGGNDGKARDTDRSQDSQSSDRRSKDSEETKRSGWGR